MTLCKQLNIIKEMRYQFLIGTILKLAVKNIEIRDMPNVSIPYRYGT